MTVLIEIMCNDVYSVLSLRWKLLPSEKVRKALPLPLVADASLSS
ncbi:MAG: hypothetical protein AAGA75_27250 [Cyanobacteria bacterium P01_E01_bin.6]